jgi:anti-sigma factor RsiW
MTNDAPIVEDELQAYVDGRLPEARRVAVEAHLAQHPDVRERVTLEMRQRASLRGQLEGRFTEPVPPRLWIANIQAARRATMMKRLKAVAAGALIFIAGAGAGWFAAGQETVASLSPTAATTSVAQNANAAYRTFVVEVAHPVEVASAQEGHLLQWLSRRLGRPLVAPDLTPFGYRLMGGRLLPGNGSAAAQLMYDDASGRRLTLYVRAAAGGETAFRFQREGDAATFAWIDQGFGFAVTAPVTRDELMPIAEAVYRGFGSVSSSK